MQRVSLPGLEVLSLTDAAPHPAEWSYAFPQPGGGRLDLPCWAPDGLFRTRFTVHVLVRDGAVALIDAGIGPDPVAYFGGLAGSLADEFGAAGLSPGSVSLVAFTHFHLDHVGWASVGGRPFFCNARYVAPEAEVAHWRSAGSAAALPHHVDAVGRRILPLLERGALDPWPGGAALPGWPDLSYLPLPGHTSGHCAVVRRGQGGTLVIAGDAWHSPAQVAAPDWCHRADRDPGAAIRSRRRLARFAAERRALVAAGHFPAAMAFGRIMQRSSGAAEAERAPQSIFVPLGPGETTK